jgi:hypothetical protein
MMLIYFVQGYFVLSKFGKVKLILWLLIYRDTVEVSTLFSYISSQYCGYASTDLLSPAI